MTQASVQACDVLVIGGGPAGTTAAALLAEQGRQVIVLEKDAHPRFHIGESLLPCNLALFGKLGIASEIEALAVFKPGAEFVCDATGQAREFRFADARDRRFTHAYQVRRDGFDALLAANARRRGALVLERTRVTKAQLGTDERHVLARDPDGATLRFAPRFVLDASGRDTFLAGTMRLKQADKRGSTAAVFAHYRNVAPRPGVAYGCIIIHLADDGWFWTIPLPDGVTSVGFVGTQAAFRGRGATMPQFLAERIRRSPTLAPRMGDAALVSEVMTAGNYAYRARAASGEGWMLIGDAFGFLDPVFSSGVLLAMESGALGAQVAAAWLEHPGRGHALASRAEKKMRRSMDRLGWLIHRINTPALRAMLLNPRNELGMRDAVLALLAGHFVDDRRDLSVPMFAFRSAYAATSLVHRLGVVSAGGRETARSRAAAS